VGISKKLAVCLECGFTQFTVPERDLSVLVHGAPVEGAVVLAERIARASEKVGIESLSPGIDA
jgi:hypothetical protein